MGKGSVLFQNFRTFEMSYIRIFEHSIRFSKRNRVSYFRIFMHIHARELSPPLTFCLIIEYPPQTLQVQLHFSTSRTTFQVRLHSPTLAKSFQLQRILPTQNEDVSQERVVRKNENGLRPSMFNLLDRTVLVRSRIILNSIY